MCYSAKTLYVGSDGWQKYYMGLYMYSCTHVICCHQMHEYEKPSFAYLFLFANNKKVNIIQNSVWTTVTKLDMIVVVVVDRNASHLVCHYQMCIFDTSFAYLFRLADNKKGKYPEFCITTVMKLGMRVVVSRSITCKVLTFGRTFFLNFEICNNWK